MIKFSHKDLIIEPGQRTCAFNLKPLSEQLEILNTYYPIGKKIYYNGNTNVSAIIIGYKLLESNDIYNLIILGYTGGQNKYTESIDAPTLKGMHIANFHFDASLHRNLKIKELGL